MSKQYFGLGICLLIMVSYCVAELKGEEVEKEKKVRVAVLGYHFKVREDEQQNDRDETLAAIAKRSWGDYCQRWGYDLRWYSELDPRFQAVAQAGMFPTWFKYRLLADLLATEQYDAVLYVDSDTLWTGGDHDMSIANILASSPSGAVFFGYALNHIDGWSQGKRGAAADGTAGAGQSPSQRQLLSPHSASFQPDLGVVLFRNQRGMAAALEQLYNKAIKERYSSEATILLHYFPLSDPEQPRPSLPSFSLGPGFVAQPLLWQPHFFALHLTDEGRQQEDPAVLARLASLRRRAPLTSLPSSKLPRLNAKKIHSLSL